MKKTLLAALSAIALLMVGLFAAAPANAIETTSNANLYNSSASAAPVYFQTASGGPTIYSKPAGQTHIAPAGAPITYFYVRSGCRMEVSGNGVVAGLSGGVWYRWVASNGVRPYGTATVRVYC